MTTGAVSHDDWLAHSSAMGGATRADSSVTPLGETNAWASPILFSSHAPTTMAAAVPGMGCSSDLTPQRYFKVRR